MNTRSVWTEADIRALGVRTDWRTACSIAGIGRTKATEMRRSGELPFPTLQVGARIIVPVQGLLDLLGLGDKQAA